MPVIAIQGLRGGVGATSITAALAWAFSCLDESVVAVDFSPVNQLRMHFNTPMAQTRGWARAALDGQPWQQSALRYLPNLDFIPFGTLSDDDLAAVEQQDAVPLAAWRERLETLTASYRWVLLDIPAENSARNRQITQLADTVLRVIVPDANLQLRLHQQTFSSSTRFLLNQFNANSRSQQDLHLLWMSGLKPMLPLMVHRDEAMAEALLNKQPLGEYRPHSLAAEEINTLANWLMIHATESAL